MRVFVVEDDNGVEYVFGTALDAWKMWRFLGGNGYAFSDLRLEPVLNRPKEHPAGSKKLFKYWTDKLPRHDEIDIEEPTSTMVALEFEIAGKR